MRRAGTLQPCGLNADSHVREDLVRVVAEGLFEVADTLPETLGEFGDLLPAEQEGKYTEDYKQLGEAKRFHICVETSRRAEELRGREATMRHSRAVRCSRRGCTAKG